ncbi:hypothetical protein I553_7218 [Mycobacterium xenopi 4042]|uniref:Uncharacterized protein n=1 Tax=Mycobacterium xenopi 4042 TaxID=1299334 RepID=X7Z4X8_MYCXE|nr:hypothetical protein I553_7218 [Mycobacterium xenopi 4042]
MIDRLLAGAGNRPQPRSDPDDAAVVLTGDGRTVISTDMLVQAGIFG